LKYSSESPLARRRHRARTRDPAIGTLERRWRRGSPRHPAGHESGPDTPMESKYAPAAAHGFTPASA
jgi:hypothetical protein